MADQQDAAPAPEMNFRLAMDLGDQWAGRVNGQKIALGGGGGHGFGYAMRGKDHRRAGVGNLLQLLDENRALGLKRLDDITVVDDLMADIDGRPELGEGALHGVDGAHDARAKAAWGAQKNFERRLYGPWLHIHVRAFLRFSRQWRTVSGERQNQISSI